MFKQLDTLLKRFDEVQKLLVDPEVISNSRRYQQLAKERAHLEPAALKYRQFQKNENDIREIDGLLKEKQTEKDFSELVVSEKKRLNEEGLKLKEELEEFLFEREEGLDRNIIMEIRAGTGGEEAALFAADLFKMYSKYAQSKGYKVDILSSHPSAGAGFKEIIFSVEGRMVYKIFRYESGTHRVQRVPATETSGRIHTSAATVAVLLEAEEVDLKIDPGELKIDTYRSSGAGGQHVNVTDSAVRITHLPTNTVVSCQDERSQMKNRAKAMKVLRARILDKLEKEKQREISKSRKSQVGTGDRSQKIRTYNFPDRRVTDHRIHLTLYRLESILEGDMEELITALLKEDRKRSLK
ncbi:MAG: peptide chain release factor 1 [Candidatus Omnitrophica bacterium]|nr:peptide chain release factor 1 [Candidatus Omnitrophota bacterium]